MSSGKKGSAVVIKGHGMGIRLVIPAGLTLDDALSQAVQVISDAAAVTKQMGVVVETGARPLDSTAVIRILQEVLWPMEMSVLFWKSDNQEALAFLRRSGFLVGEKKAERNEERDDDVSDLPVLDTPGGEPLVVSRSLRSGQKIAHAGDVLVLGNVHSGAEILASGNVCVFGRLSGLVHAGCDGDERRFIAVDSFRARQVRIGRKVSNDLNSSEQPWWGCPVIVSIDRGTFVVTERR